MRDPEAPLPKRSNVASKGFPSTREAVKCRGPLRADRMKVCLKALLVALNSLILDRQATFQTSI